MTSPTGSTPPTPVITAVAVVGLISVALIATRTPLAIFGLLGGAISWGLWQGWRGPRLLAIFFSVFTLLVGVSALGALVQGEPIQDTYTRLIAAATVGLIPASCATILLLLLPRSSRSWFSRYRRPKS
ncbi:hypothetical protein OHA25_47255 [Nonomuraea sp. NBC_00507]|uniref:hypothetical protein n=1 Tax=Nonomuraea sp. NBC_00507 TaxID=2976002 RepID=UPI002E1835B8